MKFSVESNLIPKKSKEIFESTLRRRNKNYKSSNHKLLIAINLSSVAKKCLKMDTFSVNRLSNCYFLFEFHSLKYPNATNFLFKYQGIKYK